MSESDSRELQDLFDSITRQGAAVAAAPATAAVGDEASLYERVGRLTRQLHDTLQELGYDKLLEDTLHSIPDARDRLAYVSNLTEQAARRVLDATDAAGPLQETLKTEAAALADRWEALFANQMGVEDFRRLAANTRLFLRETAPACISGTQARLSEIMLAQDFQDLTGQVIRKIVVMAQGLEQGLLQVLIEVMPEANRTPDVEGLLNGPIVNAGGGDVVVNQQQVDDLLANLGF